MTRVSALALALVLPACKAPARPPPQPFAFHVSGDPGRPLAGAQLRFRGNLLATSDAAGVAPFALEGRDGETYDVSVECPAHHRSPAQPVAVTIRRLATADEIAEYDVACPPTTRTVVVAVKGVAGRRLPVLQLGQEIARTDATGVATVVLHPGPEEQVDLTLDTHDPDHADLRPQNPVASFLVKDRDEIFVFDPHFTAVAPRKTPRPSRASVAKGPPLPIRIQ